MRIAVVLFNLGGPDSLTAVRPFLRNLFSDPAIIALPSFVRHPLAALIAARRAPTAMEIYRKLGGGSPILPQTRAQADALDLALQAALPGDTCKCFVSMRYWHPFASEVALQVRNWKPDRIVLLPLYPQLSTTTSRSSFDDWERAARKSAISTATQAICCYPVLHGFIEAAANLIRPRYDAAVRSGPVRLLFSAHGLPEKIVACGDPYPDQIERSAAAISQALDIPDLDWAVCYQSRVGPLKWIGPSTEEEIGRAGRDGRGVVLFPISFVSEHSETLVELDIEYAELARTRGVACYERVPTVGTHEDFMMGLASLVARAVALPPGSVANDGSLTSCGASHAGCPIVSNVRIGSVA